MLVLKPASSCAKDDTTQAKKKYIYGKGSHLILIIRIHFLADLV